MLKWFLKTITRSAPPPMRITFAVLEQIRRTVGNLPAEHGQSSSAWYTTALRWRRIG